MKKLALVMVSLILVTGVFASCAQTSSEYTRGTLTDTVYSSEWAGITFTASDDMTFATDEEIDELMDFGSEVAYGEDTEEKLNWAELTVTYEMMATDNETGANVLVMTEKIPESYTMDEYIDAMKMQVDGSEVSITDERIEEITFAGQAYTDYSYTMAVYGMGVSQTMYMRKIGDRIFAVCFSYEDPTDMDKLADCFSALK